MRITTYLKKQNAAAVRAPSDPIADKTPSQHLRRIYSADEKTAVHALLNLLVLVILANYYTTMEYVCIIVTF